MVIALSKWFLFHNQKLAFRADGNSIDSFNNDAEYLDIADVPKTIAEIDEDFLAGWGSQELNDPVTLL